MASKDGGLPRLISNLQPLISHDGEGETETQREELPPLSYAAWKA